MNTPMESRQVLVPSLDQMRAMPDRELLALRTELAFAMGSIENQIRFQEPANGHDPDWLKRAGSAQHIRQHGISAIKNILYERQAADPPDRTVPITRWVETTNRVVDAAKHLIAVTGDDSDEEEDWDRLDDAVAAYHDFCVSVKIFHEAQQ